MTADEIILCADTLRPNTISEETKLHWVSVIEKRILEHMTRFGESDAAVGGATLLLNDSYKDMYVYHVVAMIDLTNQDIAMYNNSCAFFNELFSSWQKKWRREHTPSERKTGGD